MVVTSELRTHKVMEAAIRELMGAGTPPRFKFKDTYASIEFPEGYTVPAQATLEAKYNELLALEEDIQKTVIEGDLEVGTSNLFVDTETGRVGIGKTDPGVKLDMNGVGRFTANGGNLQLVGTNHTYLEYYPDGTSAGRKAYVGYGTADDNNFTINNDAGSGYIILGGGNVGIGTTNPGATLDVNGISKNNNPGCRVGQNATQFTLIFGATNVLKYNYVFYDTGSDYSTSTGLFTCPIAGKYLCMHMMTNRSSRTRNDISETKIFWNGIEVSRQFMDTTQDSSVSTVIIDAAANDTLNAGIWNNNASNEYNGINEGGGSQFFVHFLG
jgi:hypothetical protein